MKGAVMNIVEKDLTFTWPEWKLKSFALSYDDANIADRKLVGIFNRYGLKGTFHIPSAWLITKPENRISESEIMELYKGHEISGHGANHLYLAKIAENEVTAEIETDIEGWKRIAGIDITGYSYPYGNYSESVMDNLRRHGLIYSRTVGTAENFDLPENFLEWHPNAHHNGNIAELGRKYLDYRADRMSVFLVWGHSYEFNRQDNWDIIESFCSQMAGRDDIFYASMGEIASYAEAVKKMNISEDCRYLKNNSDMTIFFVCRDKKIRLEAGDVFEK